MTDLEQWSKRTVGVGEPRIGRDNPRGTGYPQDRTFEVMRNLGQN